MLLLYFINQITWKKEKPQERTVTIKTWRQKKSHLFAHEKRKSPRGDGNSTAMFVMAYIMITTNRVKKRKTPIGDGNFISSQVFVMSGDVSPWKKERPQEGTVTIIILGCLP